MDLRASMELTRTDLESILDGGTEPKALQLSLLKEITDDFSEYHQIGRGGFSSVYKGNLQNGSVAIKKLYNAHMYENEFLRELQCLMIVKHKNIVRFLGYCVDTQTNMEKYHGKLVMADTQQRLLCFEYLPNGSLDRHIKDSSTGLDWRTRYQIIKGICEGLNYLHQKNILHLDLKPANILLDPHMIPKITDFGLSRCFDEGKSLFIVKNIAGTLGYLAPEFTSGVITKKLDLYSLGVIIIEILTGERGYPDVENVLESWRNRFQTSDTPQLEQIRVCTEIGMQCSHYDPEKRPESVKQIINRLLQVDPIQLDLYGREQVVLPKAPVVKTREHKEFPSKSSMDSIRLSATMLGDDYIVAFHSQSYEKFQKGQKPPGGCTTATI